MQVISIRAFWFYYFDLTGFYYKYVTIIYNAHDNIFIFKNIVCTTVKPIYFLGEYKEDIQPYIFSIFVFIVFFFKSNYILFRSTNKISNYEPPFVLCIKLYWLLAEMCARNDFLFITFFYLSPFLQAQFYLAEFGIHILFFLVNFTSNFTIFYIFTFVISAMNYTKDKFINFLCNSLKKQFRRQKNILRNELKTEIQVKREKQQQRVNYCCSETLTANFEVQESSCIRLFYWTFNTTS